MKPTFHVWYSYKSGMGIELVRVAPLLKRLSASHRVMVASYHAHLYEPAQFSAFLLTEGSIPVIPDDFAGDGVCFFSEPRPQGPSRCDVLHRWAAAAGWQCVDETLGAPNLNCYAAAEAFAGRICPGVGPVMDSVLRRRDPVDAVVLNLLGGASVEKGFRNAAAICGWVRKLADIAPQYRFIIPVVAHQARRFRLPEYVHPSVEVVEYPDGSSELTELLTGCRAVVTVEGGPLHLSVECRKPVLLLAEESWLSEVGQVLPSAQLYRHVVVVLAEPHEDALARDVATWLTGVAP